MTIKEITDQTIWTTFFNEVDSPSFHQSWEWGEFQKTMNYDIFRLGLYEDSKLVAIALVLKLKARRGSFLFVPHGPLSLSKDKSVLFKHYTAFVEYLKQIAVKEKFAFIRIAPILDSNEENQKLFTDLGMKKAPIYMHAERMWALDITKSEDELLADMRKTTRYSIKKAAKDGAVVEKRDDENVIDDFWKVYKETFTRESFAPFSHKFITNEYQAFKETGNAQFFFGKVNLENENAEKEQQDNLKSDTPPKSAQEGTSKNVAGALIVYTKSTAFYHQGASLHTKIPVPYLLQWESIREAKRRGCKIYNFYGILHEGRTPKAWEGLTLFKKGFGGYQIDYLATQDFVLSPKYYLSFAYEQFLNWKRGV